MNKPNSEKVCALLGLDPATVSFLNIMHRADGSSWFDASVQRRLTEEEVAAIHQIELGEIND
jgi:hypothetical protein